MASSIEIRSHLSLLAACSAAALLLVASGCGDDDNGSGPGDDGGGDEPTAAELTGDGWDNYEGADLDSAESFFTDAVEADSTYADAWTGLGWVDFERDSLGDADADFGRAIDNDPQADDAWAGKAALLREVVPPDYQGSVDAANEVLGRQRRYVFAHDTSKDWMDLRLILAQSFFDLTEYDSANVQVDSLGGTPSDPDSSWYVDTLAVRIERLGESIID